MYGAFVPNYKELMTHYPTGFFLRWLGNKQPRKESDLTMILAHTLTHVGPGIINQKLLDCGANPNTTEIITLALRNRKILEHLQKNGLDINAILDEDFNKNVTPELIKQLLESGASPARILKHIVSSSYSPTNPYCLISPFNDSKKKLLKLDLPSRIEIMCAAYENNQLPKGFKNLLISNLFGTYPENYVLEDPAINSLSPELAKKFFLVYENYIQTNLLPSDIGTDDIGRRIPLIALLRQESPEPLATLFQKYREDQERLARALPKNFSDSTYKNLEKIQFVLQATGHLPLDNVEDSIKFEEFCHRPENAALLNRSAEHNYQTQTVTGTKEYLHSDTGSTYATQLRLLSKAIADGTNPQALDSEGCFNQLLADHATLERTGIILLLLNETRNLLNPNIIDFMALGGTIESHLAPTTSNQKCVFNFLSSDDLSIKTYREFLKIVPLELLSDRLDRTCKQLLEPNNSLTLFGTPSLNVAKQQFFCKF